MYVASMTPGIYPSLSDILEDPIVRAVMRSDGVSRFDIERLMAGASEKMRKASSSCHGRDDGRHLGH
jgi:hypothetical protein